MKVLYCRDIGFDCQKELRAANEEEMLEQVAEHGRIVHGIEVTPELAAEVRSLIRDEGEAGA